MFLPQSSWMMGQAGANAAGIPFDLRSLNFIDPGSQAASDPSVIPGSVSVPNLGGIGDVGEGLGALDIGRLAIGGLQTLGGLWNAFQAQKLAKQQFRFQKDFAQRNLTNSVQDYNTKLEDRIRSRAFTEGRDASYADSYLEKNRLSDQLRSFSKKGG